MFCTSSATTPPASGPPITSGLSFYVPIPPRYVRLPYSIKNEKKCLLKVIQQKAQTRQDGQSNHYRPYDDDGFFAGITYDDAYMDYRVVSHGETTILRGFGRVKGRLRRRYLVMHPLSVAMSKAIHCINPYAMADVSEWAHYWKPHESYRDEKLEAIELPLEGN
jgi:hypothetical protein